MRDITLNDTFIHHFTTRQFSDGVPTTLAGTPVLSVHEEGNDTFITTGVSVDIDIGASAVAGLHEATIVATAGNGYEAGKSYCIFISTGTVGGVSVVGEVVGHFTVAASAAAVDLANGTDGLTELRTLLLDIPTVSEFDARTIPTANYFDPGADTVTVGALNAAVITAASIAGAAISDTKFAVGAVTASALASDAVDEIADGVWDEVMSGHTLDNTFGLGLQPLRANTATAGAASTITLDAGAPIVGQFFRGQTVSIIGGTGAGQTRIITNYSVGRIATVTPNWNTNPASGSEFVIEKTGPVNVAAWRNAQPTALVGGSVIVDVANMQANVIDAASINAGAITAAKISLAAVVGGTLDATAIQKITDGVLDELTASHVGAGSVGEVLDNLPNNGLLNEFSSAEKDQIRDSLGIDGAKTAAAGGQMQLVKTETDKIVARTLLAAAYYDPAVDTTIVGTINANVITAASINAAAIVAAKFGAGAIDATSLNADAVDKIRDGILPTQNIAFDDINFLFVAASDGRTPVTGASGMTVQRSIDSSAFVNGTGTGPTEIANGMYQYDASAADMNGGKITFKFTATGGTPGAPDNTYLTLITGGGV